MGTRSPDQSNDFSAAGQEKPGSLDLLVLLVATYNTILKGTSFYRFYLVAIFFFCSQPIMEKLENQHKEESGNNLSFHRPENITDKTWTYFLPIFFLFQDLWVFLHSWSQRTLIWGDNFSNLVFSLKCFSMSLTCVIQDKLENLEPHRRK